MSKAGDCSCFQGTAVLDMQGNCRCIDEGGQVALPQVMSANAPVRTPTTVYHYGPAVVSAGPGKSTPEPAATVVPPDTDNTILGMPPLVALGLGAAALYFMSQMGDNKKQKQ